MPDGFHGRILRLDLTAGALRDERPGDNFYRQYLGGKGFVAYYLFKEVPPGVDPLGSENRLIFAAGVVSGAPVPGFSRFSVGAKSPLTGGYGESEAGGFWAAELKFAGYDAIVVQGKAEHPVYLWIHNGVAELKDAGHLWGLDTAQTQARIKQELGDQRVQVACIGPAGRWGCAAERGSTWPIPPGCRKSPGGSRGTSGRTRPASLYTTKARSG